MAKSARTLLLVRLLQLKTYNELVEALRRFDLTPLQYMVLSLAGNRSGSSTADLARRFHIAPQSMNEVIAALEAKKLIARRESPGHRRILHIRFTAAGTKLLQKCEREVDRIERSIFRDFDRMELALFRGMLATALAGFEDDAAKAALPSSQIDGGRRAEARAQ
ncbi:MAG TPA: MarR family transcriptional regulator [Xanthobacteraceae bacterium]|nr:MarR family transcriptional regulator [Xanthobacteraceae bacterium]